MLKRVFPKYSPFYYLVDSKVVRKKVAPIAATECINQDEAASIFYKDEVTGFPVDVLRDVVNGENVTSPLLKPHQCSFPPSGLSDAEIMALGQRSGVDTLVERDIYLSYVDSQVELTENKPDKTVNSDKPDNSEPAPESKLESKFESKPESTV